MISQVWPELYCSTRVVSGQLVVVNTQRTRKSVQTIRCAACGMLFIPEPRAAGRQRFCSASECRKASQLFSQRQWAKKNPGFFSGPENTQRMQDWRKTNPDYHKTRKANTGDADLASTLSGLMPQNACPVLQDSWASQTVAIVGIIAWIRGARGKALQKTIAFDLHEIMSRGHAICRKIPLPRTS